MSWLAVRKISAI